jgi:hypothetical protein
VRDSVEGFAATTYLTVPGPVPFVPSPIVTQETFDVAVHVQDEADGVTLTAPAPPSREISSAEGEIVNVQTGSGCVGFFVSHPAAQSAIANAEIAIAPM